MVKWLKEMLTGKKDMSNHNRMENGKKSSEIIIKSVLRKPDHIRKIFIPRFILTSSRDYLFESGKHENEGLMFWAGKICETSDCFITTNVYPKTFASMASASIRDENDCFTQIIDELEKNGLYVFIQIHSHPGEAFHSGTDNQSFLTYRDGFFSIVVPNYAKKPLNDLSECAIFEKKGQSIAKLDQDNKMDRFVIIDSEINANEIKNSFLHSNIVQENGKIVTKKIIQKEPHSKNEHDIIFVGKDFEITEDYLKTGIKRSPFKDLKGNYDVKFIENTNSIFLEKKGLLKDHIELKDIEDNDCDKVAKILKEKIGNN